MLSKKVIQPVILTSIVGWSVFVLLLSLVSAASASWTLDGTAVCSAPGTQSLPSAVSDGSGGAVIVWQDLRAGNYDIYAQRVDADGNTLWTSDGIAIVATSNLELGPVVASDGAGGVIVVWIDDRTAAMRLYAQRLDVSGNPQWTSGGVSVCTADFNPFAQSIVADGLGGAIVSWVDRRGADSDIYAERLNSSGSRVWLASGVPVCTQAADQHNPVLASDGLGAAVIAWVDKRSGTNFDIYAQGLNFFGTALWTGNGIVIANAAGDQYLPGIVPDGFGGAVIAWQDERAGSDIYAQRVNAAGTIFWAANGNLVGGGATVQINPVIASDGNSGAIVAWQDWRTSAFDIYAQNIQLTGSNAWTTNGVEVSAALHHEANPRIIPDGAGGAVIVWEDERNVAAYGPPDIYAQRIDNGGSKVWNSTGVSVCKAVQIQDAVTLAPGSSAASPIVAWNDFRSSAYDIYALRIILNTQPGNSVMVAPPDETTGESPVTITFDEVTLEGVTTLVTGVVESEPPAGYVLGATSYNIETTAAYNANVEVCISYNEASLPGPESDLQLFHFESPATGWISVTSSRYADSNIICGVTTGLSPFALGVPTTPSGVGNPGVPARYALYANWPNPFNPTTAIEFDVPDGGGDVALRVYDVSGGLVRTLLSGSQTAGRKAVAWDGRDNRGAIVGSGIYFYRLTSDGFTSTRKMVLLK